MAIRLVMALAIIFTAAFGLTIYLDLHKFERTLQDLARSRVMVQLRDLTDSVELATNLGLSLESVRAAQGLIDHGKQLDDSLTELAVIGRQGSVLFDTDQAKAGTAAPAIWAAAQQKLIRAPSAEAEQGWQARGPEQVAYGDLVRNNIGGFDGSMVAVLGLADERATLTAVAEDMIRTAAIICAATLAALTLAIVALLRPLGLSLDRMTKAARDLVDGRGVAMTGLTAGQLEARLQIAGAVAASALSIDASADFKSAPAPVETDTDRRTRRMFLAVFMAVIVLLAAGLGAISWYGVGRFSTALGPEFQRKADAIGRSVTDRIGEALALGIPFDQLRGVNGLFTTVLNENREIERLTIENVNGRQLYADTRNKGDAAAALVTSYPIHLGDKIVGWLKVSVDGRYVADRIAEILYDLLTVLVVSLLIAFEVLMVLLVIVVTGPIRLIESLLARIAKGDFTRVATQGLRGEVGRLAGELNRLVRRVNQQLAGGDSAEGYRAKTPGREKTMTWNDVLLVRIPLFLFIFAEELTRPFLPLYIKELYRPVPWLTPEMVIGLPISVFMLTIAAVTPWAGVATDRWGTKRVFLIGLIPSITGFVGAAMADSVVTLVLARSFCAAGYAIVYIACQGFFAQAASSGNRTRGMALFMGAVFAAAICGPAIGGILADRLGPAETLLFSAALLVVAGVLVWVLLPTLPLSGQVRKLPRWSDVLVLAQNRRLVAATLLGAIPAKIILTGFLFYLVPLYLASLDASQGTIGRVIMVYGLMNVLFGPLMARFADRVGNLDWFVAIGGIVSGLGMLAVLYDSSVWTILAAVMVMGIAHAGSIAPQLSLVQAVSEHEAAMIGQTSVLSIFRLVERLGNVVGPFVVAAIYYRGGYVGATVWTGMLVAFCSLCFIVMMRWRGGSAATAPAE